MVTYTPVALNPASYYDITATLPDNGYRDPMFIIEAAYLNLVTYY
jgi:hypothetical protein